MRFAKVLTHARPPEKVNVADPGVTLFSAEDFKVGHGEVHAFRTGIMLEVPKGAYGHIVGTQSMGVAGATILSGIVTPLDTGEVRIAIANLHRNAYEVKAGMPIGQLIIIDSGSTDDEAEEYDREGLTNEMNAVRLDAIEASKKLQLKKAADLAKQKAKGGKVTKLPAGGEPNIQP